ncbi:MAG: hypothetical protein JSV19_10840 [Phycisphaerales bacterium]|nr:MAG: hypothetical protein JSV19_10840 [Phycisphaerales bacterium]
MKQKRRQELQENELALMLKDARDFLTRHGNYVIAGVMVLVIAVALFLYIRSAEATARDNAYQQIRAARFIGSDGRPLPDAEISKAIDSLQQVGRESKDPDLTRRTLLMLSSGVLELCVMDPQTMNEARLQVAEDACKRLLAEHGMHSVVAGTALLNLATIEGNRFVLDGDMSHKEEARNYLTRITRDENGLFTGTPFMERALEATNQLDDTFQIVPLPELPPTPRPAAEAPPQPPTDEPTAVGDDSVPDEAADSPAEDESAPPAETLGPVEPEGENDEPGGDEP